MVIISWNVNGLRAILKKKFLDTISILDPDILCLQETKAPETLIKQELSELKHYHLFVNSAQRKGYSGTLILSKNKPIKITKAMGIEQHDLEGRLICLEFSAYYLVNIYVPNSGQKLERLPYRQQWDADFQKYLENLNRHKPVLVVGDFNVAHQALDLKNDKANYNKTAGYTQIEIDGMSNLIKSGFIDVYRRIYPNKIAYTYWSYRFKARDKNIGWRIDYFLASTKLLDKIKSVEILEDIYGSDHCPIKLEIAL